MYLQVGGNGKILNGTVYGSMDGETWEELSNLSNLTYSNQANTNEQAIANTKNFEISDPQKVQFVKIVANSASNGNWFAAREFNLFQDITKNPHPTAGIAYSTTESTNGKVVARLVNPSTQITITNNEGSDTYVFMKNGEFTFEFQDANGNKGSALAKVTWIDKDIPTANIKYKLDEDKLIILLDDIDEDVYILDENNNKINYVDVENGKLESVSYLDNSGDVYKIVYVDENGKTKKISYKNTIEEIDDIAEYVVTIKTQEDGNEEIQVGEIEKEEFFNSEGIKIDIADIDNEKIEKLRGLQQTARSNPLEFALEESGEYEFKLLDKAENIAYKSIKVDYIENDTIILASDISYDITRPTNKSVVATIRPYIIDTDNNDAEVEFVYDDNDVIDVKVIDGVVKASYVFTDNCSYTFRYKSSSDVNDWEIKEHIATVNWIDKINPTAKIKYSTQEATNKEVIATLVDESETIIITNNGASREHVFTENGSFTFTFEDKAGNLGTATANVNWIREEERPDKYILGDINKDGKITATDLLAIKRHLVSKGKQEWILTGDKFKAGDINKDNAITATDLLLEKRLVLAQIKTK